MRRQQRVAAPRRPTTASKAPGGSASAGTASWRTAPVASSTRSQVSTSAGTSSASAWSARPRSSASVRALDQRSGEPVRGAHVSCRRARAWRHSEHTPRRAPFQVGCPAPSAAARARDQNPAPTRTCPSRTAAKPWRGRRRHAGHAPVRRRGARVTLLRARAPRRAPDGEGRRRREAGFAQDASRTGASPARTRCRVALTHRGLCVAEGLGLTLRRVSFARPCPSAR